MFLILAFFAACGGVSKNEALNYNENIVDGQMKVIDAFNDWNNSEENSDSLMLVLSNLVDSELKRTETMNNLGDDADFKNAYITFLNDTKTFLNKETDLLNRLDQSMAEKMELSEAEIDAFKLEEQNLNEVYDKNQNDFLAKQKVFTDKYGLVLEEGKK
jgi:CMP-N-acetylneuraminic acid synthetase